METDDSDAHTGSKSFKITADDATGDATQARISHDPVPLETNKTYTVAFWAKVYEGDAQSRPVRVYAGSHYEDIILDSTDWKEYTFTFDAGPIMVGNIHVGLAIAQSAVNFWVDDFRFFEGTPDDDNSGSTKGDVSGDGKVDPYDAVLTLRIAARLLTPTEKEKQAADMNDDGSVKSDDAIVILRRVVGLAAPGIHMVARTDGRIIISLAEAYGVAGESVIVPLKVDNTNGLAGGDICIVYDSAVLHAVDVSSEPGILLASSTAEPGMVQIAFAGVGGLNSKTLARIRFDILADDISPLTIRSVELYGPDALPLIYRVTHKEFTSWAVPPERSALLQNFPNPFNPETWIPYQLREDSEVSIRVFNVQGNLVRELELGYKPAGLYISRDRAAYWDGRDEAGETVASGIYFYSIRAGDFAAVKKLIVLK